MKKIAYSFGMFDLLHYGHIKHIDKLNTLADLTIIGVLSDEISEQLFGRPLSPLKDRLSVIKTLNNVDEVLVQDELSPINVMNLIQLRYPDYEIMFCHSNSWLIFLYETMLKRNGFNVIKTDYSEEYSNDKIKLLFDTEVVSPKHTFIDSKGETLLRLKNILKSSFIEPLFLLYRQEITKVDTVNLQKLIDNLDAETIIIRSSSNNEDGLNQSNAGKYLSRLNVNPSVNDILESAKTVFDSYGEEQQFDHVIVQKMTTNSKFSGVIFTRELNSSAPYYLINYSESNDTTIVTSGKHAKKRVVFRDKIINLEPWNTLIDSVKEIEALFAGLPLDIEFSITGNDKVIIHQVRPLVIGERLTANVDKKIKDRLDTTIRLNFKSNKSLYLSDMSFWNPSEIIGSNPYPLSYSLYENLITRNSWNRGISSIGYSIVEKPLMLRIGNKPYIDLMSTFRALTPEKISNKLKVKLENYYLKTLKEKPYLHDKVEFGLIFNSYTPSIGLDLIKLHKEGFSEVEIEELSSVLNANTRDIIVNFKKNLDLDMKSGDEFNETVKKLMQNNYPLKSALLIFQQTEKLIAPIFSKQARYAFISKNLLDTGLKLNLFKQSDFDLFMSNIQSITTHYLDDYKNLTENRIAKDQFLDRYGHLRSGTYDITSLPYSISMDFNKEIISHDRDYISDDEIKTRFIGYLNILSTELSISDRDVIYTFLKNSISSREYFKFIYSKGVSEIIEKIVLFGEKYNLDRTSLQYISIEDLNYISTMDQEIKIHEYLEFLIKGRKEIHEINSKMILPEIVFDLNDFYFFESHLARPNFVTKKAIKATAVFYDSKVEQDYKDKLVFIENADPGYDWLFNKGISGLITKYGGAASHMAIRCSELGIPAAIGIGDILYDQIIGAKRILLDARNQKLEVIE